MTRMLGICLLPAVVLAQALPSIAPDGVVNSADYTSALAPGMLFSLFGSSLSGGIVTVNDRAATVLYSGPSQINAQLPFGVLGTAQVRVRTAEGVSSAAQVNVARTAPRLFTRTMDGKGEPLLVHAADWTLVTAAAPAEAGEHLVLFLTGLGEVGPSNEVPAGRVTVELGGKPAAVHYAGLAPGFAGLNQINFQAPAGMTGGAKTIVVRTPDGATQPLGALVGPSDVHVSGQAASSSKIMLSWNPPSFAVDHYEVLATEATSGSVVIAQTQTAVATVTGLKAATEYAITVRACADAPCRQSGVSAPTKQITPNEVWQLQGRGNTTAGLDRILNDGNARLSATRFGPEAGAVTANRIQLYYGPIGTPGGPPRQILSTALTRSAVTERDPASYLQFTSSRGTTGLLTPVPAAPMIEAIATGQGVPMTNGKVRLFFEAQGPDRRTRIFSVDSADGFTGQDFNTGAAAICSTAADYSPGGGCAPRVEVGVSGDAVAPAARIDNARQHKVGYPTLSDWRWDGAPGTFLVFTTDRIPGCTTANMNHGYAVWDRTKWDVQYESNGCPKLFTNAQAAFPLHIGEVRYKLYYGDPSVTAGRLPGNLPFLGPKKLIYADGAATGQPERVDFEDWESQTNGRDVIFLWPNGDKLNDTAEGYIDDYHFLTPTGNPELQVMYLVITNGVEVPFTAAAVLTNP